MVAVIQHAMLLLLTCAVTFVGQLQLEKRPPYVRIAYPPPPPPPPPHWPPSWFVHGEIWSPPSPPEDYDGDGA